MQLTLLGHAGLVVRSRGLTLLVDPVADDPHFEGVFRMVPSRTLDLDAIRPDFVFVSHAHLDHFQPSTLHRIARRDPDVVVVTADPFVADTARRLGFRDARVVPAGTRIALHDLTVDLTPSIADEPEWGLGFSDPRGAVWHQVDTVLPDANTAASVARAIGGDRRPSLVLARFAPLLEVAAQLGDAPKLPLHDYDAIHRALAAANPHHVLPASSGAAHVVTWMNQVGFPVSAERFARDVRAAHPGIGVVAYRTGAILEVDGDRIVDGGDASFVSVDAAAKDPRRFDPIVPPLVDPGWSDVPLARQRDIVRAFAAGALRDALVDRSGAPRDASVRSLRVPLASGDALAFAFLPEGDRLVVREELADDPDLENHIPASILVEVLAGRRSLASALLAGMIRVVQRTYRPRAGGIAEVSVAPIFLYQAIDYAESMRRAVRHDVARILGASSTADASG